MSDKLKERSKVSGAEAARRPRAAAGARCPSEHHQAGATAGTWPHETWRGGIPGGLGRGRGEGRFPSLDGALYVATAERKAGAHQSRLERTVP